VPGYPSDERQEQCNKLLAAVGEAVINPRRNHRLGIDRNELLVTSGDLRTLIGRPTTAIRDAVRAAAGRAVGA
jgi:NAD(P)H dehydrogenase (quinone)